MAALKLTRWETALTVSLYAAVGLLATLRHRPWLLMFLIFAQGTVYLCGSGRVGVEPAGPRPPPGARDAARRTPPARSAAAGSPGHLSRGPPQGGPDRPVRRGIDQSLRVPRLAAAGHVGGARRPLAPRRCWPPPAPRSTSSSVHPPRGAGRRLRSHHLGTPVRRRGVLARRVGAARAQLRHVLARAARRGPSGGRARRAGLERQPRLSHTGPAAASRPPSGSTRLRRPQSAPRQQQLSGTPTGSVSLLLPAAGDLTSAPGTLRQHRPVRTALRRTDHPNVRVPRPGFAGLCRDGGQRLPTGAGCPLRPQLHHVCAAAARPDLPGRRRRRHHPDAHPLRP